MLRKFCLAILVFATLLFAEAPVSVEAYDEQANDPNQVTLRIRLTNHTEDTLQNVRLRYFLDDEKGRDLTLSPYYLPGATLSIDTLDFKRIAVYLEGVLIAGESPTDRDVPQIRISAFQPEKAAWGQWVTDQK